MSTALFDDGQTLLMLAAEQGWTELSAAWGMAQGALSRAYSLDVSFQPVTPENDDDDDGDDDDDVNDEGEEEKDDDDKADGDGEVEMGMVMDGEDDW